MPDYEKLIERLTRQTVIRKGELVAIDMHDGRGPQKVPTGDTVQLRNPDGIEAAEAISTLLKERDALRAAISWIEPPFVTSETTVNELRKRVGFVVADLKRAALSA